MSSFKKALKSNQKQHRERGQLSARQHLGHLEKKKDYKKRADEYHRKEKTLKALKKKALDKNPDEFYFNMVRSHTEDGVHKSQTSAPEYTDEQLKLIDSQDINYVNFKRSLEQKKIEKLKGSLHLIQAGEKPKNKHIVFLDSKKEVKEFDAAKHFDTHPALLDRSYNRLRTGQLKEMETQGAIDDSVLAKLATERNKKYKELGKRLDREKKLHIISQKMEMKRHLRDKKSKKTKVKAESVDSAAVYRWCPQRKR